MRDGRGQERRPFRGARGLAWTHSGRARPEIAIQPFFASEFLYSAFVLEEEG
jgi:hypothetical protein